MRPISLTLTLSLVSTVAAAQSASPAHTSAWGIADNAVVSLPVNTTGTPHARAEFVSEGPPQTVALYLGVIERGTARLTQSEESHRDLCTTPCARDFVPHDYELFTHGAGVVSGLHHYVVPPEGVRFVLRARPSAAAAGAGVSIALGVLATLGSIALFANASFNGGDFAPAWGVLGAGVAFGLFGGGLNFWAQSTGIASSGPIASPHAP